MKPVLALRHVPHEGLGLLDESLRQAGLTYSVIDLPRGAPRSFQPGQLSGLIVLGGPMNVDDVDLYPYLADEVHWVRQAVEIGLPVLGICLGSQMLAKALGARVYPNDHKEIGWYPVDLAATAEADPLFGECSPRETVFQWHGDTFDLPEHATLLASSPLCRHQAFSYGPAAYGIQFHLEVTAAMIEDWLRQPANCVELSYLKHIDPDQIRRETTERIDDLNRLGRKVLGRFAELCKRRGG